MWCCRLEVLDHYDLFARSSREQHKTVHCKMECVLRIPVVILLNKFFSNECESLAKMCFEAEWCAHCRNRKKFLGFSCRNHTIRLSVTTASNFSPHTRLYWPFFHFQKPVVSQSSTCSWSRLSGPINVASTAVARFSTSINPLYAQTVNEHKTRQNKTLCPSESFVKKIENSRSRCFGKSLTPLPSEMFFSTSAVKTSNTWAKNNAYLWWLWSTTRRCTQKNIRKQQQIQQLWKRIPNWTGLRTRNYPFLRTTTRNREHTRVLKKFYVFFSGSKQSPLSASRLRCRAQITWSCKGSAVCDNNNKIVRSCQLILAWP